MRSGGTYEEGKETTAGAGVAGRASGVVADVPRVLAMTDGHTKEGSFQVTLNLTGDMVWQLARLLDMAKMIDGHDFDTKKRPETLDVIAYRAFLEEILQLLYKSIDDSSLVPEVQSDSSDHPDAAEA